MKTAKRIVTDEANAINGEVQHNRIARAAEKEAGVVVSGGRNEPFYRFEDGSGLKVCHTLGDYKLYNAEFSRRRRRSAGMTG